MLHSAVQKWSNRKAPGADGWRPAELKQWPIGLFNLLVVFYEAIEGGQPWPAPLDVSLVALLAKGGTEDPEDRRPIVLLPIVYRLWAAVRAAGLRRWLSDCGVLPPPPWPWQGGWVAGL